MLTAQIAVWVSLAVLVYAYVAYPLVLALIGTLVQIRRDLHLVISKADRRVEQVPPDELPRISLIVPAYNEEESIGRKVQNSLALDYPPDRLEIIIASDGSTDGTNRIVESFHEQRVVLAAHETRRGKPSVLNDAVESSTGEILVFSDATAAIEPDALQKLARHFRSERVGVVNGELRFVSAEGEPTGETLYWKYETVLKFMENRLQVVLGSSGSLCAVRRAAFRPLPPKLINDDLLITLNAQAAGYRAVYDPEARSTERTAPSVAMEAERRKRIAAGNFQALLLTLRLLSPLRGRMAFCYFSHKVLKWTTWAFMASALLGCLPLLDRPVFLGLFVAQTAFYGCAAVGALGIRLPLVGRLISTVHYFVSMHWAMFVGFVRFVLRTQRVAWDMQHR